MVQPTVSWHRDEYAALGVPFGKRGAILDEQLEIWAKAWSGSPVTHEGYHYPFGKIWLEPQPVRRATPRRSTPRARRAGPAIGSLRNFGTAPGRFWLTVSAVLAIVITADASFGSFYKVTSPTILAPWFALGVLALGFVSTFVTRARRSTSAELADLSKSRA